MINNSYIRNTNQIHTQVFSQSTSIQTREKSRLLILWHVDPLLGTKLHGVTPPEADTPMCPVCFRITVKLRTSSGPRFDPLRH
jgi:hypothetical protein